MVINDTITLLLIPGLVRGRKLCIYPRDIQPWEICLCDCGKHYISQIGWIFRDGLEGGKKGEFSGYFSEDNPLGYCSVVCCNTFSYSVHENLDG